MMGIIKTGFFIDGIEVTSEHIGKKLKVLKSDDNRWLPVGFVATITAVYSAAEIYLQDTSGKDSYCVDITYDTWEFEWATSVGPENKKEASTKPQRKRLAKAIREAKATLDLAVSEAEKVGMVVKLYEDGVDITFDPPIEKY